MRDAKFQIYKDSAGEFRFRLLSKGNLENILHSTEGYSSKQGCQRGIDSVKVNAPYDSRYARLTASNGQYYFILKAANGEELGRSEYYTTKYAMENGISAVKRDAPNAPVEDLTLAEARY